MRSTSSGKVLGSMSSTSIPVDATARVTARESRRRSCPETSTETAPERAAYEDASTLATADSLLRMPTSAAAPCIPWEGANTKRIDTLLPRQLKSVCASSGEIGE